MRPFLILTLLLSVILSGCFHHDKSAEIEKNIYRDTSKHEDYSVRIKIPTEWIEKLRRFDYSRNTKGLLREFEIYIKPDTILKRTGGHIDEDYGRVINPLFVDLDGEPGEELICLLGWDVGSPSLCVFKQLKGNWYLLYLEETWMFNDGTEFSVANNFSKNKVFYCRHLYSRGTCVYADGYCFYKLIGNKVYKCLELINEANTCGWSPLNRDVKLQFKFDGDDSDGVFINYTYNFFYTPKDQRTEVPDVALINGDAGIGYKWDNKSITYKIDTSIYKGGPYYLTAEQIACFGDFKNNSLFLNAFKKQINEALKSGSKEQKKVLKEFIYTVKKTK